MRFSSTASFFLSLLFVAAAPIDQRQSCAAVYVIFARGTTEPPPLGLIVGPIFSATLAADIPGVAIASVIYDADILGYLEGGDPAGIANAESLATAYAASCPDARIVLSGYSQGAQIAHKALNGLQSSGSSAFSNVKAIVTWGDPYHTESTYGVPFQYYCAEFDEICANTAIVTPAHLTYGVNGDAADGARWVASTLGV